MTLTQPCGVNLRALVSRLMTICLTFCRSLRTSGSASPSSWVTASFERAIRGSTSASTSPITSGMTKSTSVSGILPASMRLMSRMSLMIDSRWCELESIRSRLRRCCPLSSPETPLSSMLV